MASKPNITKMYPHTWLYPNKPQKGNRYNKQTRKPQRPTSINLKGKQDMGSVARTQEMRSKHTRMDPNINT